MPIYRFDGLKQLLTDMGYHIEEAAAYRPIADPIDVGIQELTESFNFTDDGIFYVDESGLERQVYLYKRKYHLRRYGRPRYHICRCETIDQFILSGSFEREYRASNTERVPVTNMDENNAEEMVDDLPMCRYCQRKVGEGRAIASNEFVELLRNVEEYQNRDIDVDIFGYARDWERISHGIREDHNFTCEQCGVHVDNMADRYSIHVHHMNGNKADNRAANLKCLCIRCHSRIDDRHRRNFSRGANLVCLNDFNERYPER